ncbi:MAG: GAF domain-containing protein [Aliarcobacter sp.]|nr:GAF domain-containing protein [Aliarcobacter sp.]
MNVISAPSAPQIAINALSNLKPGPKGGSCGNAVFKSAPQFVKNTFTDERWEDLRDVAIDFNICSCWSMPIRDKNQKAIGSFALSSFEHRMPNSFQKKILQTASSIVNISFKK